MTKLLCKICRHSKSKHFSHGCEDCFVHNVLTDDNFNILNRGHRFVLDNLAYLERKYEQNS